MKKILAIDDNNDNLISIRAIIKDSFPDSVIETASNGAKGIELALTNDPDVILLDVLMPEMDGFEVCRRLKDDSRLRDIPVVFLTAIRERKESRIEALEIGAEAFLSKPIDVSELTAQIRAMVKIKAANRQKQHEKERLSMLVAERTSELEQGRIEMIKLLEELKTENESRKKIEAALRESEERFYHMFDRAPLSYHSFDIDGVLLDVNKAWLKTLGYKKEEVIGKKFTDFIPSENQEKIKHTFQECKMSESWHNEVEVFHKNGDIRVICVDGSIGRNKDGSLDRVHCIFQDVTEMKRAEEQIKTFGKAIEQGPSSIVITNEKGEIEFVNKKFTSLTQYSLNDVLGKKPRIFNHGHMPEKDFGNLMETLHNGKTWNGEVLNRRKDHTFFWEENIISTLMDPEGNISNYVLIMNDVTEKKQMLDELIKAKEKAEESDRLKSAFLANMSHEIRTPLNCIIGFSELMLDADFDSAKMAEYARMINIGGNNMLSIINDIMDISKIETGQLTINKCHFPVKELVANVQEELSYKAKEKGLQLKFEANNIQSQIKLDSDERKLKQILSNLIGNAIKFSKEGIIEIGLKTKGDFLLFYVRDMGIGIAKEFHEKIFERFSQVESNFTREYGGNGLGLAISKSLVHLLGGEIWVESEVGEGSVFYFTIPV